MTQEQTSEWFYCIIQNPGANEEQIMGFKDDETQIEFLPIFKTKEEAEKCFLLMPKDIINSQYEIQALLKDDFLLYAEKTNFKIFLMNEKGQIINELEK
ncbi:MAG: hypothetical protein GY707_01615 [Desulfobacteraceae bacterium]|nr:hypothetical protein [Desulfobacteraceae bacterium]